MEIAVILTSSPLASKSKTANSMSSPEEILPVAGVDADLEMFKAPALMTWSLLPRPSQPASIVGVM